jgi:diguanylate cyclase (GGDEF)-like protein
LQDTSRLIEAFDAGADDYVRKPVSPKVLVARLRAAQRVLELHDELERDREQMRRFAADLAIENRRYQQAALTDPLTGFPNRRYVVDRLEQEWASAKRTARPFACLLVDIDHFKRVNDTHGHDVGDVVLKHTAQVLRDTARVHDVISRLGGEEFLVLCPDTGAKGAQACAERLRAAVEAASISVGSISCSVTISIGVAVWNKETASSEALVKAADVAVYAAKEGGRNQACYAGAGSKKRGRKKTLPIATPAESPLTLAQD